MQEKEKRKKKRRGCSLIDHKSFGRVGLSYRCVAVSVVGDVPQFDVLVQALATCARATQKKEREVASKE